MQGTLMLGAASNLLVAPPFTCCRCRALPQRRATCLPVCSIPTTVQAAAAVAYRDEVLEQQADLLTVSSAVDGAKDVLHGRRAVADNPQSAPGSTPSTSPWQQQRARLAISDAQQMQAGLMAAEAQAVQHVASQPRQQQGSHPPTRRRHPIARASDAAQGQHAVLPQQQQREQQSQLQHQPPRHQQPQRRGRPSPQDLQRSRRSAPLQTAVRSNKQHDWQVMNWEFRQAVSCPATPACDRAVSTHASCHGAEGLCNGGTTGDHGLAAHGDERYQPQRQHF
jgi:hypothetical protein